METKAKTRRVNPFHATRFSALQCFRVEKMQFILA